MGDLATGRQTNNLDCFDVVAGWCPLELIWAKGDTGLVESISLVSSESICNDFEIKHDARLDGENEIDRLNLLLQWAILYELVEGRLNGDSVNS